MAETETTPLLVDMSDNAPHIEHIPASAHLHRMTKRLTAVILVISVLALLSLITEFVIVAVWPFNWYIDYPQVLLLIYLLIATFFSIINLYANVPILFNLIVDIVLAFCIISSTIYRIFVLFIIPDLCGIKPGYPRPKDPNVDPDIPPPGCHGWSLAAGILTDIGFLLGGIVGLLYVVLLILRTIALFRTKFWNFSTRQVTFQVTFRVITQDNGDIAARGGADAPSTSL